MGKINFQNAILDTKTQQMMPHNHQFRFFSKLPVEYNFEAYPDADLQQVLLNFVDGDLPKLELLRGLIRRAVDPAPQLQTGFWIYGPPGTGKSTFVNWLISVTGSLAAEMVVKNVSLFTNARLRGKSLIVISDGDNLNPEVIKLIKNITGRDRISYDWKHEMLMKSTFVSSAVVVVTSNLSLANSMLTVYDEGFVDRMIEIPFTFIPKTPQAGLKAYLERNTAALINWAFTGSKEFLQSQVRAGRWAYSTFKNNPYIDFLSSYLVEEKKGFILNAELLDLLDEYLRDNGHSPLTAGTRRRAPQILFNLLQRSFSLFVRRGRDKGKGPRGIYGVRHRDKVKDRESPFLQLRISGPPLECSDPFKRHPITPYAELSSSFAVSSRERENQENDDTLDSSIEDPFEPRMEEPSDLEEGSSFLRDLPTALEGPLVDAPLPLRVLEGDPPQDPPLPLRVLEGDPPYGILRDARLAPDARVSRDKGKITEGTKEESQTEGTLPPSGSQTEGTLPPSSLPGSKGGYLRFPEEGGQREAEKEQFLTKDDPSNKNAAGTSIEQGLHRWWNSELYCPKSLSHYVPWYEYPQSDEFESSYRAVCKMPSL